MRINGKIIKAIQNVYQNSISKIKMGSKISGGFAVSKGLRQGCCLSPTLFKIYIHEALKIWRRKCSQMGVQIANNNTIYTLHFADDQIVMARDQEDMEYMIRKLVEEYKKWGLNINTNKSKYLVIGDTEEDLSMEGGKIIKHCNEVEYLGVKINNNGKYDEEIKHRNHKGKYAISTLNGILWDKHISRKTKSNIYNSIVKSIITYGADIWPLKRTTQSKLLVTEMDFWRRAARVSRKDKIRNSTIRQIMGVKTTILDFITHKQLRWYGHVRRMPEDRIPKNVLEWIPPRNRKRGRPATTWMDNIKQAMKKFNLQDDKCNNREEWRRAIGRCVTH